MIIIQFPDTSQNINYYYDDPQRQNGIGRLTNINNTSANLTLSYDKAHRLTSVTTSGAMPVTNISYEYYKNDLRRTMTDVIGITNYTPPTKLNPLETIASPNTGTFTFNYDNLSRRTSMTMGNGITATYNYDDASQLTNLAFKNAATPITSNNFIYDLVGNRTKDTELAGANDYTYDAIYRLKTATHPTGNPAESFTYDAVGNRTLSHLSSSYTTNELNRLTEDNSYLYTYDADGNMISKTSTSASAFYYFDAENKLVQVDKYNASSTLTSTSTYSYDGFGRRVKKSISTSTSASTLYYIYDNEDIRFETDGAGAITAEYTHGMGIDEPLAMRRNGTNYYYHSNGLGSITALTDSTKAVVQSYIYDSFGQIISQTGSITNPYTFTGREYDSETGSYYYRARYYDARMGKFITTDPLNLAKIIFLKQSSPERVRNFTNIVYQYALTNPQVLNEYLYVGNNPVNEIDPLGLFEEGPPSPANWFPGYTYDPLEKYRKPFDWGCLAGCLIGLAPAEMAENMTEEIIKEMEEHLTDKCAKKVVSKAIPIWNIYDTASDANAVLTCIQQCGN